MRGEIALEVEQRRANRRDRGDERCGARPPPRRAAAGPTARIGSNASGGRSPRWRDRPDRRSARARAEPSRGRARRCRDGRGRSARRAGAASVPLPEAAGPSIATTNGRRARHAGLRCNRAAEAVDQRDEVRKAGGDRRAVIDPHRLRGRPGPAPETPSRCDGRAGSRSARRPRAGRHCPRRSDRRHRPQHARRRRRGPAAIAVSRSLSLTRSSASPRMTVRPRAQAAATARIGYSSIIRGARSGGMSAPVRVPARTRRSATGSPPSSRSFTRAISAPISRQAFEQSGAQRIEADAFDRNLRSRHDQRRDQRERGRRDVARHRDRRRREFGLALDRDALAAALGRLGQ